MTATKKLIPGKRIKTWHRSRSALDKRMPLRSFARSLTIFGTDEEKAVALAWANGKVDARSAPSDAGGE